MKVLKYKKATKGRYKVYLDNNQELLLYEEVILKYELLLKKEITLDMMIQIDKDNQEWDVYYLALNHIRKRIKSIYELKEWLINKDYPEELVDKAISKLIEQGYLDDRSYARSYINHMMLTSSRGPYKIERELLDKRIDSSILNEEFEIFTDEDQEIRIHKIIRRGIKSNSSRGGVVLKQKIYNDLKALGYDISIINKVIDTYTFEVNSDIAKKEYNKLQRKLSRKYKGEELEKKIQEKMYLKGLSYKE